MKKWGASRNTILSALAPWEDGHDDFEETACIPIRLSCSHVLGKQCFNMWRERSTDRGMCPQCRQRLQPPTATGCLRALRWICNTAWFRYLGEDFINVWRPREQRAVGAIYCSQRGWPLYDLDILAATVSHVRFYYYNLRLILLIVVVVHFSLVNIVVYLAPLEESQLLGRTLLVQGLYSEITGKG